MHVKIVGRNSRADGAECIVFGAYRADGEFAPISRDLIGAARGGGLSFHGDWMQRDMRAGPGLEPAPALVASNVESDYCRGAGRFVAVSHRWSGMLQINDIGRRYIVDLYSERTRLVLVDAIDGLLLDVTAFAAMHEGALVLPRLNSLAAVDHIAAGAWFRFLDRDADFDPGPARRLIEGFRPSNAERLRLRIVTALLPALAAREILEPPSPSQEYANGKAEFGRDAWRLLAAAVDGIALRAARA